MRFKYLVYVIVFLPFRLLSQNNYSFQHLTVEDGLASNKISIFQDAEGFYWFANINGIQRFDGKNFINYKFYYDPSKPSKADSWLSIPVEDNEKNIWFINSTGVNIFYRKKEKLLRLYMTDAADSSINNIASVIKDARNNLWIITNKNIFAYDYNLHKPVLYKPVIFDKNAGIQSVQYDKANNCFWLLIAGSMHSIARLDIGSKHLIFPLKKTVDEILGHQDQTPFFKLDESKNLWIANYVGDICRYNIDSNKTTLYTILHERAAKNISEPNSRITDAIDDKNGSVWFGGDYHLGLLRFDKKIGNFYQQEGDNGSEYGFHYNEIVYSFFEDNEKNIWINTDLGMNIFNPHAEIFKYLIPLPGSSVTKFSADISSVFQSASGNVWISTWGDGVFEYDSNLILHNHYIHYNNNPASFGEPLNRAWCFAEDKKQKLWIGCQHGMLSVLNTSTKKFVTTTLPAFKNATVMREIKVNNEIWFGLYNGSIAKLDETSGEIIVYDSAYKNPLQNVSSIDGMCADNAGNIWWSPGANGIRKFDIKKNVVTDSALFPLHISYPVFLNDSVMIGGTDTKGLFILNVHTKSVRFFNTSNGLSTNDVFGAIALDNYRIWIFANDGIHLLNLQNKKVSDFNIDDGIKDHELQGPFYQLRNGTILFATTSGIIYFNPKRITTRSPPPKTSITDFTVNNKSYSVDSLLENKNIVLSYKQNVVTINYASLSFNGRSTNKYYYKLTGVDKDWASAGTRRSVTYANLSHGNYIFYVHAQNADGLNSKYNTVINIVINPPWWRTWWAYLLWIAVIIFIGYWIYTYRKRNRAALADMRQKIASDLHDDIGSTLNSISIYSEVATQQIQGNVENAKSILYKMGSASRNMIDTMNDIVWSVNPKNDQFENILQRMQYFAAELLSGKNILLQFSTDIIAKNIKLSMEKRKNFYLVFKEAINNACKYAQAKNISININETQGRLVMTISDDGIGFNINSNSNGNGLKNMQQRAKEIHAEFKIKSTVHEGTSIQLIMPVK